MASVECVSVLLRDVFDEIGKALHDVFNVMLCSAG
jgi:hypothetical protein